MKNHYSSPVHPQANGQAEVANRSLLKIIKTRLEGAKGVWPDELPGVLWAYRTTVRTPTGETLFKLAYGSEAVIPVEVHMMSHRVRKYQAKGIWPDELPGVLWAYRTTVRTPTGETPFKLAYGSEAVIPEKYT